MKKRAIFPKITLALIFICIPNINIIDFLPDFVAYFLLWSIIGELDRMLPYFAELKTALKRLGLVTLIKLPATLVMFANLHTGRDIIPLFTLIFSVIELILIIQAVNLAYSALSYLGERSGASSLIMPFKVLFGRMSTDTLRSVTCVYAVLRAALAFIPDIRYTKGLRVEPAERGVVVPSSAPPRELSGQAAGTATSTSPVRLSATTTAA